MAIADQIITTIIDAVAALNARVDDLSAQEAIPGPQGERGPQGEPGADGTSPTDEQIKAAAADWLAANITQPLDGAQGPQGERGPGPTDQEIALAVDIWFEANAERLRGPRGDRGDAGPAGANGADGRDGPRGPVGDTGPSGADGVGIALVEQRNQKGFWITLTDGREFEVKLPQPKMSNFPSGGGSGVFKGIDLGFY